MSSLRTFTRNILSNYLGFVVQAVVMFLLRPVVIDTLGDGVAGIWFLIIACTGYYGLLDLGIRSAVGQYVTRYWAMGDMAGVSRTLTTALGLTSIAAGVLLIVTAFLALFGHSLFGIRVLDAGDTALVFAVVGGGVAINFPLAIFQSATYARQRFDVANAIGITERMFALGLYWWVLTAGYGIVGLAFVHTALNLITNVLRVGVAFALLPGLRLRRSNLTRESARELWGFGIFNVLVNAADQILANSAAIVIALVLAEAAITYYDNGAFLVAQYLLIVNQIAWVLTPHATSCDSRGDLEGLRRLWLAGSRVILIVASLIAGGIVLLGEDFIRLWLGASFVSGEPFASSATVAAILAVAALVRCGLTCGKQICFGLREVRFLARVTFAESLIHLGLAIALVHWFGLIGVASASLISTATVQLWLQPRFVARRLGTTVGAFLREVPWGGVAVLSCMVAVDWLVAAHLTVTGWGDFLIRGAVVAVPALIAGVLVGTTRAEKERLLARLRARPRRSAAP